MALSQKAELTIGALLFFTLLSSTLARYEPNWDSLGQRDLPEWFDKSKFGIFLHWGVYSVPSYCPGAAEWFWAYWAGGQKELVKYMKDNYREDITYQDLASKFSAELYNPSHWADIFKSSGAKYVILTTKHHEGYTLWPSSYSWNWNAVDVGSKRDLLGELVEAVRNKTDLHFGTYYSLYEWYNPTYRNDKSSNFSTRNFINNKLLPELKELVNKYRPELIWSDGEWDAPDSYWNSPEFIAWLYNDSPVKDVVVTNSRWAENLTWPNGCYESVGDNELPVKTLPHKWESAMTLDRSSWGFRRNAKLTDYLPIETLIARLAQIVSLGGNLAINVGPTSDGRIDPILEERLRQMGSWLAVNGEAIYESQPTQKHNDSLTKGVWYTQRKNYIYGIVLNWPRSNVLRLGSITPAPGSKIQLLGWGESLTWNSDSPDYTTVIFPFLTPNIIPCQWGWTLKFYNATQVEDIES